MPAPDWERSPCGCIKCVTPPRTRISASSRTQQQRKQKCRALSVGPLGGKKAQGRPIPEGRKDNISKKSRLSAPCADEAALQQPFGRQQLMDRLPQEIRIAICRDALLRHMLE